MEDVVLNNERDATNHVKNSIQVKSKVKIMWTLISKWNYVILNFIICYKQIHTQRTTPFSWLILKYI